MTLWNRSSYVNVLAPLVARIKLHMTLFLIFSWFFRKPRGRPATAPEWAQIDEYDSSSSMSSDEKTYRRMRDLNNAASKRCRLGRKRKSEVIRIFICFCSIQCKVIEIRWLAPMRIMLVCRSDFGFVLNKGCQSHFNAQTKHIFSTHDISIFWITVLLKKHLVVIFRDFALIWLCF